jgi:hypothetical protein
MTVNTDEFVDRYLTAEDLAPLFEKALESSPEAYVSVPEVEQARHKGEPYEGEVVNLRLDWELTDDAVEDMHDHKKVGSLMAQQAALDLNDLVLNGDSGKSEDALLHALNGERVRGKEPKLVEVISTLAFWEPKPRKETVEYTVFILLHTVWD